MHMLRTIFPIHNFCLMLPQLAAQLNCPNLCLAPTRWPLAGRHVQQIATHFTHRQQPTGSDAVVNKSRRQRQEPASKSANPQLPDTPGPPPPPSGERGGPSSGRQSGNSDQRLSYHNISSNFSSAANHKATHRSTEALRGHGTPPQPQQQQQPDSGSQGSGGGDVTSSSSSSLFASASTSSSLNWHVALKLHSLCSDAKVAYCFTGSTAAAVHGAEVPGANHSFHIQVQWDAFDALQRLMQGFSPSEVERLPNGARFYCALGDCSVEVRCQYNHVVAADPDRAQVAIPSTAQAGASIASVSEPSAGSVWAKSLYAVRRDANDGQLAAAISQRLATLQARLFGCRSRDTKNALVAILASLQNTALLSVTALLAR